MADALRPGVPCRAASSGTLVACRHLASSRGSTPRLSRAEVAHLKQLLTEWGLLADLCFADMLLYVPTGDASWVIVGQVRPATGQTIYVTDHVGTIVGDERPLLTAAYAEGEICEGEIDVPSLAEPARMMAIPIRHDGRPIAVLTREWTSRSGRLSGELERTYLAIFQRFAAMIAEGSFPFPRPRRRLERGAARSATGSWCSTRVAGALRLAERQLGAAPGRHPARTPSGCASPSSASTTARSARRTTRSPPVIEEFDQSRGRHAALTRCMPFLAGGPDHSRVTGGVLLLRDVTELRKRDRLLLPRTRRSVRSTTGSRTTCRRSRRCCGCRGGG